ncbi:MAG: ribosome small subunit-dependent GTPase A [Bacteroidales bacterium]|nr:ribosome small subunit-dependent GTPase A [Bacteroidales bacterium]
MKGIVIKSTGSWYSVQDGKKVIPCKIKGKLRLKGIKTTNPVTVGDNVEYIMYDESTGLIERIEERKNYIIRRSTHFSKEAHLLAANVDQAMLMVSVKNPVTPSEFMDRFLVSAEAYYIKNIIIINKIDLLDSKTQSAYEEMLKTYQDLAGYECISVSVEKNINIEQVKKALNNKTTLIAGNSGVGKTSLINVLIPDLDLKTEEISDYHKAGKHTTTFSELFQLNDKSNIIDSPGIKGFGLIDIEKSEIAHFFPEIFSISKNCKYYNCTHIHEPDCAVIDAVQKGLIAKSRYKSYENLFLEENSKYRT